jgi:hypothetical protein
VSIALLTIALMGTASLLLSIILGYQVSAGARSVSHHFLIALGSTTLLVMAHSFIMFFLIATGVELKNMEKEHGWGDSFRRRTIALKGQVFPIATMALLLVIANFILGAAAHTRAMPVWIHQLLAWATFATCALTLWREYLVLGANNRLIEEAGMKRASGSAKSAG